MTRTLLIISGSSRPGRVGPAMTRWIAEFARQNSNFEVKIADLGEINLPLFDEANHPRTGKYEHQHTKDWAATVADADAFVIVTPEYNHAYPAVLKNALDYLSAEWRDKPVGFLSYGGVSGGTRAVEALLPVITVLGMIPTPVGVVVPFGPKYVGDDGEAALPPEVQAGAQPMLDELARLSSLLKPSTEPEGVKAVQAEQDAE